MLKPNDKESSAVDVEHEIVSDVFKCLSDGTRRALITFICQQGASRVTDLASMHEMSLNAISKHIKILERTGLVKRTTIGRTHWIEASLEQISLVEMWLQQLKSIWSLRLDSLANLIEQEKSDE